VEVSVKAIDRLAALSSRLRRREVVTGLAPQTTNVRTGPQANPPSHQNPFERFAPVDEEVPAGDETPVDAGEEAQLWRRLHEDPNDVEAFPRLAEIVRRRAGEGHVGGDQQRAADDAVWALAEELAHNHKAWYPLIELARLSVHDDRDAALRRLATASDRDPSGRALATGLAMLRETQLPSDALGLGVAHWRPREHDLEAGRHLVLAAIEAGRISDARRHLAALSLHPDEGRVAALRAELEGLMARLEAERRAGGPMTDPAGIAVTGPLIDLRDAANDDRGPFRHR